MNESIHIGAIESTLEVCSRKVDAAKQACADKVLLAKRQIRKLEQKSKQELHNNISKILSYTTDELMIRHSKMNQIIMESVWRRSYLKFRRDLQYFSVYLSVEATVPISLTYIPTETPQGSRCRDTVIDSIDKRLLNPNTIRGTDAVKVASVFKINNQFLSESFQVSIL